MIGPVPISALVVVLSMVLIGFSWGDLQKGRDRRAVLLLLVSGLLLRTLFVAIPYMHSWDERFHALVAKHMMQDPFTPVLYPDPELPHDITDWSKSHVWLHKPPLPMWSMAASMSIFGVSIFSMRLPSLLLSLILILLCHDLALQSFDRRVAWTTAFLASIHGLLLQLTGGATATDHIDLFVVFFITLAIWAAVRWRVHPSPGWAVIAGSAVGCAILSKWIVGSFALMVIFLFWYRHQDRGKFISNFTLVLIACMVVALPWEAYIQLRFPEEAAIERGLILGHFESGLEGRGRPWWYHIHKMGMLHGELVYLPMVWLIWMAIQRRGDGNELVLLLWIMVPYVLFSFARTKMQAYTIICAPAIFMAIALFIEWLSGLDRWRPIRLALGVLLITMPVRIMLERVKPWQNMHATPDWMVSINQMPLNYSSNTVIFNAPQAVELMFHRDVIAYEFEPNEEQVEQYKEMGYHVLILPDR